jgi:hypothetical protein
VLDKVKELLTKAPILVPPVEKELLLVYIVATTQVVSATLVVEREEEGHALKMQCPMYFISEVLYVILIAKRKLCHYFESHPRMVVTSFPISEVI